LVRAWLPIRDPLTASANASRYAGLPCRISATDRETLAGFSPQTAKPETFAAKFA
jgi:hypothetical protein